MSGISRRELMRRGGGLMALAGAGSLIAACAPSASAPTATAAGGKPKQGGTAVISLTTVPDTLFAGVEGVTAARGYNKFVIGDGLVRVPRLDWKPEPALAESWSLSPDGLTYTFKLRKGVAFHDTQPFGAKDVKFTFELLSHPKFPIALPGDFGLIAGAKAYKAGTATEISGIKITGDDIAFTLTDKNALFLTTTAATVILPQHLLKDMNPADARTHPFGRKPIYTGPFMFDDWREGEFLKVKANDKYWGGRPNLDAVVNRLIPDLTVVSQMLKTGEVMYSSIGADLVEPFKSSADHYVVESRTAYGQMFHFDLTNPSHPTTDIRVRQAMSHAIDRETFVKTIMRGYGEPGLRFINNDSSPLYNPNVPTWPYDPAKAKALLDAAGWRPGADGIRLKDGKRLEFTMNVTAGNNARDAQALLPMFEAVGITYKLKVQDFGSWVADLPVGRHEALLTAATGADTDPRQFLAAAFEYPRAISTDRTGFRSDEVNALFKQARATTSSADEKKLYDQILMLAEAALPYVYVSVARGTVVVRKELVIPQDTPVQAGGVTSDWKNWSLR